MNSVWQDIRHGIRAARRAPWSAAVIVCTIGLGVGACATMFSAVHAVLLRPLPYLEPHRLIALRESNPRQDQARARAGVSPPNFTDWRTLTRTLSGMAAFRSWGFVLTGRGEPERVAGAKVSANLFSLLGEHAVAGRTFVQGEDVLGREHVVVVSEELWRRRFGADARLVGQTIALDGASYEVVGVIRAGFRLPEAQLWVPLAIQPYERAQRGARALSVIARLAPGTTLTAAREDMAGAARTLEQRYPGANAGWGAAVVPLDREVTGAVRSPLLLLFAAVAAVFLIAATHLAILLLARTAGRRREIAVRMAIGADHARVIRLLVTENVITSGAGGVLGLLLAIGGTVVVSHVGRAMIPRSGEIGVSMLVVAFGLGVSLATGIALAWIAAVAAARVDLSQSLKTGAAALTHGRRARLGLHDAAVVGQFAITLSLLVCSGLVVRSLMRVQSVDLGFSPAHVLTLTISLPDGSYPNPIQRLAFHDQLQARVAAIPGVRTAGVVSHLPLTPAALNADLVVDGERREPHDARIVRLSNVSGTSFDALGIGLRAGRVFDASDRLGSSPTVVIDASLARRMHTGSPTGVLGRHVRLGATLGADTSWRRIVGVVGSIRATNLEAPPAPSIYVPYVQNPWPTMSLVVAFSGAGDPARVAAAVRREVAALDANQPVYAVRTLDEAIARALAPRRLETWLLGAFALSALLLALLGVYAVVSFGVTQRTRELGIRIALGGQRRDVLRLVVGRVLRLMMAGLVIGSLVALVASRWLASRLFDVMPWDPATFLVGASALAMAGLLAAAVPARRATRVDPMLALRRD